VVEKLTHGGLLRAHGGRSAGAVHFSKADISANPIPPATTGGKQRQNDDLVTQVRYSAAWLRICRTISRYEFLMDDEVTNLPSALCPLPSALCQTDVRATLVSARAGGAAEKAEEPKPKQQGARVSCERSCQGQPESSPRCSSMRLASAGGRENWSSRLQN